MVQKALKAIKSIQLSDGALEQPADWPLAAVTERQVPGEGLFDLASLVPFLPGKLPIGIEVPSLTMAARMPTAVRVAYLLEQTRRLMSNNC